MKTATLEGRLAEHRRNSVLILYKLQHCFYPKYPSRARGRKHASLCCVPHMGLALCLDPVGVRARVAALESARVAPAGPGPAVQISSYSNFHFP